MPARVGARQSAKTGEPSPPSSRPTAEQAVRLGLHALAVLVPLATSNLHLAGIGYGPENVALTFDQFDAPKVFFLWTLAFSGLTVWAFSLLARGGRLWSDRAGWLLAGFLVFAVLSTVFSVSVPTSIVGKYHRYEGLLTFLAYASVYFLAMQVIRTPQQRRSLARTITLTAAVIAGYGVLQYLGLDPVRWGDFPWEPNRSFSTLGNPDLLGGYLVLPLGIGPALALTERDARWRLLYFVSLVMIVAGWVTAFTRGAWIGGAAGLFLVGLLTYRHRIRPRAVDLALLGAAGIAAAVVAVRSLSSPSEVTNVAKRLASIFSFGEGSAQTRMEIWQSAWRAIQERPLVGHGPDTFRLVFRRFQPAEYIRDAGHYSVADNTHNYPLQLAAGVGVPAALLFYGFVAANLWSGARRAFRRSDRGGDLLYGGFWAAAVAYAVYLMFGLSVVGSSVVFWMALGVLAAPIAGFRMVRPRLPRSVAAVVGAIVIGVVLALGGAFLWADHEAMKAEVHGPTEAGIAAARRAVRLNPLNDIYRGSVGVRYMEEMRRRLRRVDELRATGQDPAAAMAAAESAFRQAVAELEAAIDFVPTELDNYINLATIYNVAGGFDPRYLEEAVQVSQRALQIAPVSPAPRYQMALAYMKMGDLDRAVALATEAVNLDPRYTDANALLGEIYTRKGDLARAKAFYEAALAVAPQDEYLLAALRSVIASLTAQ